MEDGERSAAAFVKLPFIPPSVAQKAWDDRARYVPKLTSLEDATRMALECGRDLSKPALLFADVADNPGGGGRGNTIWILESFHRTGVEGALLGIVYDPVLAAEARSRGAGTWFLARFNRDEPHELSGHFEAEAQVLGLHEGSLIGARGISAGHTIDLGAMALLRVGGIRVVVVSVRQQASPASPPPFSRACPTATCRGRSIPSIPK